jgi:hypothetical protein
MLGVMEMLGGVLVFRRIAAAHVPANQAQSQMDPGVSHLYALRTDMRFGGCDFDFVEVCTFL